MNRLVLFLLLTSAGLVAGVGYNGWIVADAPAVGAGGQPDSPFQPLDMGSYASGLLVGLMLATIGFVRVHQIQSFLSANVHIYKFAITTCFCLFILYYL